MTHPGGFFDRVVTAPEAGFWMTWATLDDAFCVELCDDIAVFSSSSWIRTTSKRLWLVRSSGAFMRSISQSSGGAMSMLSIRVVCGGVGEK